MKPSVIMPCPKPTTMKAWVMIVHIFSVLLVVINFLVIASYGLSAPGGSQRAGLGDGEAFEKHLPSICIDARLKYICSFYNCLPTFRQTSCWLLCAYSLVAFFNYNILAILILVPCGFLSSVKDSLERPSNEPNQ